MFTSVFYFMLILAAAAISCSGYNQDGVDRERLEPAVLEAHQELKQLVHYLQSFGQPLTNDQVRASHKPHRNQLVGFSFSNCASPESEQVVVSDLKISPDPLKLPGNVTISGHVISKAPFGSPVKLSLQVYKRLFGSWVKVPCIDGVGSCDIADICSKIHPKTCPPEFVKIGLNCKCPFTAGNWTVPPFTFGVHASVPVSGGLKVKANVNLPSHLLTCVEVILELP